MPEQIRCPSCAATLRVPESLLGKNVKCPKCQTTFTAEMEQPAEPEGIVNEPTQFTSARRPTIAPEGAEDEHVPEDEDRPRRRRRGGRFSAAAASAVSGPAIALMVVGGLAIALSIVSLLFNLLGVGLIAAAPPRGAAGAQQPGAIANVAGGVFGAIFGICWESLITVGAVKMKQLQSYGLAMTACIVAMLPCNLCCLLGLPFGIWGLVALNNPEVKDAFS